MPNYRGRIGPMLCLSGQEIMEPLFHKHARRQAI
jgi:hypothetical protein